MKIKAKFLLLVVLILLGLFLPFWSLSSPKDLPDIEKPLDLAQNWLINDLDNEGYFKYKYDPKKGYSRKNNMIRQLMSSKVLAELAQERPEVRDLHRKNLDYIFANWYKEDGERGYILYKNKSKLGAAAMLLRTLVFSPYFEEYKKEAQKLYNTILYLQNEDGSFRAWYIEPDYSYSEDYLLTFYSGEALTTLVEYYERTGDKEILKNVIHSQDFYIDHYVTQLSENYYPAYVPWHTQSLNKLYKITGDKKYAKAIFILNDELLKIQNQTGRSIQGYLGRFYNPAHPEYGSPHSSSDGVYTEGLAYAYEIAKIIGDKRHQEKYKKGTILGAHNLINLQFTEINTSHFNKPWRLIGAIRYKYKDDRIRIDTTQHTIDAFRKIKDVL